MDITLTTSEKSLLNDTFSIVSLYYKFSDNNEWKDPFFRFNNSQIFFTFDKDYINNLCDQRKEVDIFKNHSLLNYINRVLINLCNSIMLRDNSSGKGELSNVFFNIYISEKNAGSVEFNYKTKTLSE